MYRVVVLDHLAPEGLELLDSALEIEYEVQIGLSGEPLRQTLANFDGAICRSGVKITAEALNGNRRLRTIARAGVGTDNIDRTAATRLGIVVMNTPSGNTLSTAEHAFTLMLALSRNVFPAYQSLSEGRWDRKHYMGTQLADKTLGIVGLGRIGQEFAKRATAFQLRILGFDPFISPDRATELGVKLVETVHEMLPQVDYLTVHTPLTNETRNLISFKEIEMIKSGARLINCARGGIYDEQALAAGLQSGKLAGVALDVYENEPCTNSPLFGMAGTLCTPHLGASTEEAQTQVAMEAVQLVVNYLTTGEIRHAVNVAALDPKTLNNLRGFLDVAYRLGLTLAQLHQGNASKCHLIYQGELVDKDTKLLSAAFCVGLIEHALAEEVNIINAEVLLRDRGIDLSEEIRRDKGPFTSSILASVETDHQTYTVGGTTFGNDMPRLFRVGDFRLEAYLDGVLLVFHHTDTPGMIGTIGTILGNQRVNIAQMAVGRAERGGKAVGVLNLDCSPPDAAMQEVLDHPEIITAEVIELPPAGLLPAWLQ
jgi:D-3-phosphoglycerate dehydrogenase